MKIMAGYDTRSKTDYRAKAAEEVSKIQAKARLLEERLEAYKEGDKMQDGDVFSELATALQNAQPKIQKMCEEESDDHEAVAKLLEINDSIHRTVERYKLMKKGDMEAAQKVAAGAPPPSQTTAGGSSSAANELSLIDFDADAPNTNGSNGAAPSTSQSTGIENDLLGLDIGGESSSFGQGGGIALGFGANQSELQPLPTIFLTCETNQRLRHPRPCFSLIHDPRQLRPRSWNPVTVRFLHLALSLSVHHPFTAFQPAISISTASTASHRPLRSPCRTQLPVRVSRSTAQTTTSTCCLE